MARLVSIDLAPVLQRVATVCARHPEVLVAWVFGSATDEMRPDSDIDVAVALRSEGQEAVSSWGAEGPLEADLGWWHTHAFHVSVLSEVNAIFAVRALAGARLAYCADEGACTDLLERIARRNWINGWRYWTAVAEVNGWDPRLIRSASPNGAASSDNR